MYRLCPSYKNYCVGSCHPYTENRLYSRYCGDPFVGYEEGTPHVCFPSILFASVVLGISTPSGRRSCCILPLDCRVMLTLPVSHAQPLSSPTSLLSQDTGLSCDIILVDRATVMDSASVRPVGPVSCVPVRLILTGPRVSAQASPYLFCSPS